MPIRQGEYDIFRNACPRNCYDTCSIKTYVKDGKISHLEGDPCSSFTRRGLCVKGYSYINRVYSKDRILYPMRQKQRGSGKWERITWDNALDTIARKILELQEKDGSLLGLCLATGSGNHGVTNNSPDGMMASLGHTTRTVGTPCWPAGIDAQTYDFGDMWCNDPEDLGKSRFILLWGVNPAWCSIHSMKYIYEAKKNGATVVVIDPILTQTAAKADVHIRINPGTDGALALAMAKHIINTNLHDKGFLDRHTLGFDRFKEYLNQSVSIEAAEAACGVPASEIKNLAETYASIKPAAIWIGYGMQRHTNGGANVRAIDALGAVTGNIGITGGGIRYGHKTNRIFNYFCADMPTPAHAGSGTDRLINTNKLAVELLSANDPPVRMLWNTLRNPLSQDGNRPLLKKAFESLEMVVCVDQFMTMTAAQADIFLPVTSLFEEMSINVSYWHFWLAINEKAIEPLGECRSNTHIAIALSQKMNDLVPGSCTFPTHLADEEWIAREFNDKIHTMFNIQSWKELLAGPKKAILEPEAWKDGYFTTPSGKYEFFSEKAVSHGHNALPEIKPARNTNGPFRILTPHSKFAIHSQFQNLEYMSALNPEPHVCIHPDSAAKKGIRDGEMAVVFNSQGETQAAAKITDNVPPNCLVMHEVWFKDNSYCVQNLVDDESADMGTLKTGAPGVAIHDQFGDIRKKAGVGDFFSRLFGGRP